MSARLKNTSKFLFKVEGFINLIQLCAFQEAVVFSGEN